MEPMFYLLVPIWAVIQRPKPEATMVLIFPLELGRSDADPKLSALFTVPHPARCWREQLHLGPVLLCGADFIIDICHLTAKKSRVSGEQIR